MADKIIDGSLKVTGGLVDSNNNSISVDNLATLDTAQTFSGEKTFTKRIDVNSSDGIKINSRTDYNYRFGTAAGGATLSLFFGGTNDSGASTEKLRYFNNSFCGGSNNTIDLGSSAIKWKDIYLSGTAYLGSELQLDKAGTSGDSKWHIEEDEYGRLSVSRTYNGNKTTYWNVDGASLMPNSNNINNIGSHTVKLKAVNTNLINPNASNFGLTLPDTSSFTANKEIATTDQAFNVIVKNSGVTFTDDEYALIMNGKPTIIQGSLLNFDNPLLVACKDLYGNGYALLIGNGASSNKTIVSVAFSGTNHTAAILENQYANFDLRGITKFNSKSVPAYPSSPSVPQLLTYDTDNTLKYVDTPNINISDAYDNTKTYAVGDTCIYNNVLYKCTTAITTAEDFDATHWTATTVAELVADETIITLDTGTYSANTPMSANDLAFFQPLLNMNVEQATKYLKNKIFLRLDSNRNETQSSVYNSIRAGGQGFDRTWYDIQISFGSYGSFTLTPTRLENGTY